MTTALGQSVRRADGEGKVRGTAVYGMDSAELGMLHGRLLRSPVAAGQLRRVDIGDALALTGVRAILTAADLPATRSGWIVKDQPLFVRDQVRYLGEPIAAVAADTFAQAEAALAAIELDIEPLEPILESEQSLSDEARLIHPDWESYQLLAPGPRRGNVAWETRLERGPVEETFAEAHLVVEDEFRVPRQHQAAIEPHVAIARYEQGRFVIHSPTQYPFLVRDRVAEMLGINPSSVRVVVPTIGGGFGGKLDAMLEPYACVLARRAGRPVRVANTRHEEMRTAGPRENAIVRLRTAVGADGKILAQEGTVIADNGAYSGETVACASVAPLVFGGTYRVPVCRYLAQVVYTNTPPTAAFRGVVGPYCVFAHEQHLDHIARRLGLDRRELRMRNVIRAGEQMVNGQTLDDAALIAAFDELEKIAPWSELTAAKRPLRGVGIVPLVWITNPGPGSAMVKVNEDGTVGVITGGTEIGTGALATGVRQIVAEELQLSVDSVVMLEPDTDAAPYDAGAQGSRTTFGVGRAALDACQDVRRQLFDVASGMLEAAPQDLELVDGHVGVVGSPESRLPLAAVAATATFTVGPIAASGKHIAPPIPFDSGCSVGSLFTTFAAASYHVHLCEVEVDPETGRVEILRYVVVQDVGRIVNPTMIEGQIDGGVMQGLGYGLYEELRLSDGAVIDDGFETYRLPTVYEMPPIESTLMEIPCDYGPFGVKGAAEPPIIPAAAVVACAIGDAVGQPIHQLPVTPFAVLTALRAEQPVE